MKLLFSLLLLIIGLSSIINSQSNIIVESGYKFRINGGQCGEQVVEFNPYGGCQLGCPRDSGYLNFGQTANDTFVATRYTDSACTVQPTTPLTFNFTCSKNYDIINIPQSDIQITCYNPSLTAPDPIHVDSSSASAVYVSFVLLIIGYLASLI